MRLHRILAAATIAACLSSSAAFAAEAATPAKTETQQQELCKNKCLPSEKNQDPVKMMQNRKAKVQELLKEGKITKEQAVEITAKLDAKLKEIEEFNKLSIQQKKDKLISKYKLFTEKRIQEGKLSKEDADKLVKEYSEKIQKWDGNGHPDFGMKMFHKQKHKGGCDSESGCK